jgi:hypothetical protein
MKRSESVDSSVSPSRKRARADLDAELEGYQDHPTLYLEDGNVVIKCSSGSKQLFRVHKSYLSRSSPVFQGILNTVGEEDVKPELFRDCQLLSLEDETEEIEAILNVMYNGQ